MRWIKEHSGEQANGYGGRNGLRNRRQVVVKDSAGNW